MSPEIPPKEIFAYDPEAEKVVKFILVDETPEAYIYESTETGFRMFISKAAM